MLPDTHSLLHIPMRVIDEGLIPLRRSNNDLEAGFCLSCAMLPALTEDLSFLHPAERSYYDGLRVDKRRLSYLLGRWASKKAIAQLVPDVAPADIAIEPGVFRFPVVKCPGMHGMQVSISHCDEAAVALAFPEEHPMGIDIESICCDKSEVMRSQLGEDELALMAGCPLSFAAGCTLMWTAKEALSKVLRTGLTIDLRVMEIVSVEAVAKNVYVSTFRYFTQYKAISCCIGRYICSVVLPGKTTPVLDGFIDSCSRVLPGCGFGM
jgi:4'-phosphopantetheinyl transferase